MTLISKQIIYYLNILENVQQEAVLTIVKSMAVNKIASQQKNKPQNEEFDIKSIPFEEAPTAAEKEIEQLLANSDKGQPKNLKKYAGAISKEDSQLMMKAINDPVYGCNRVEEYE